VAKPKVWKWLYATFFPLTILPIKGNIQSKEKGSAVIREDGVAQSLKRSAFYGL
jgi:hypothetical protein